jgi:glycosyltransferase involved in cell wall biosynthesis
MIDKKIIKVIIPALNEEASIGKVIADIPDFVDEVIVVDNGSTDNTILKAKECGATVLTESEKGYGAACLKGIEYVKDTSDIIVFLDGDYSDFPSEMDIVVNPILQDEYDFVLGSRMTGNRAKGALLPQAVFGNKLASVLMKILWGCSFTDLGPFRAIKTRSLLQLQMKDHNYGWTVEMQIKAAKQKLKTIEVPVSYRKRIGESKVTGTIAGTIKASIKIVYVIFRSVFAY